MVTWHSILSLFKPVHTIAVYFSKAIFIPHFLLYLKNYVCIYLTCMVLNLHLFRTPSRKHCMSAFPI